MEKPQHFLMRSFVINKKILLRKNQTFTSEEKINIDGEIIHSEETVKFLGFTRDYRLDFDPHISDIRKKLQHS